MTEAGGDHQAVDAGDRAEQRTLAGPGRAEADLLVLAPWLVFGAGLGVLSYRLLTHRGRSRRQSR